MKLLSFHDQFVADLPAHDEQDNLRSLDIIQDAKVPDAQLELSERVGAQPLEGFRFRCRLMEEACLDRCFKSALFAGRQRPQLRFGVSGNCDLKGHRCLA
jgi:hypothetical protein